MSISFVGSASAKASTASFDITLPTCLENDVVIVGIANSSRSTATSFPVLTSGYTEEADLFADDTRNTNATVSWKRMGATPDTTVTCTGNSGYDTWAVAYVLRGVDTTTALDVTTTTATGINSAIPDCPAITPVTSGALVVIFGANCLYAPVSITAPTGYSNTEYIVSTESYGGIAAIASKAWSGSGAEDPGLWSDISDNATESWVGVTLALKPDTAAPPEIVPTTNGTLTITGRQSLVMAPISPLQSELAITGQTSVIDTSVPFEMSGTLLNLDGSSGIAGSFTTSADLPGFTGSFEFGDELSFDADLPDLNGLMDLGLQVDSDLPDLEGSMTVAVPFVVNSSLPYLAGLMDFGMVAVGGLPNVEGSADLIVNFDVSGSLSALSGSMDFGMSAEGQLVNLTASADVSGVLGIDSSLPSVDGVMDLGLRIEGTLYSLEGSAETTTLFEISSTLPELTGSAEFGFVTTNDLPDIQGSIELDQRYDFDVTLPSLDGSLELTSVFTILGKLPEVSGSMVLDTYDYYNVSGNLPQLGGSFIFESADSFISDGKLPPLDGSAELEIEQTMIIEGSLPPLDLNLFDFSDIASVDLSGSFTPTSDEIIRHRRGYDNG